MKVPWTEHKTNEEILKMVETERKIMDTVRSRQKRWLGHILRHDSLLRITLEGQIQGKKAYGRPRTMWLDWLLKTEEGNISYEELKMSAQDRSRWSQWRWKPAIWQSTTERESISRLSKMIYIFNFPYPFIFTYFLLLNSCDGNDVKQRVFLGRLLLALKRASSSLADVQSDVLSP